MGRFELSEFWWRFMLDIGPSNCWKKEEKNIKKAESLTKNYSRLDFITDINNIVMDTSIELHILKK